VSEKIPYHGDDQQLARQVAAASGAAGLLRHQLTESQRLATIGTIAAVIAHEFNNLLTPIVSYSQFALNSAESETPDMALIKQGAEQVVPELEQGGKNLRVDAGLGARANRRSRTSRCRIWSTRPCSCWRAIRRRTGSPFACRIQPELIVHGDAVQLEQVLLNLLINARQAMLGKGGSLTIKATTDNGKVKIQVIDTGPGIRAS
jgi:signal transduction histidine kinase